MTNYPTKEKILEKEILFKKETIKIVKEFKKKWIGKLNKTKEDKKKLLKELIKQLEKLYNKKVTITFNENDTCHYNTKKAIINIDNKLSIISTLHEFAHHIYGSSEEKACKWSIWLFKKTFKESYEKLKWKNHMLTKD